MKASLDEFSNHSYEHASLNRIIKQAGVSKGSFYYHFANKEDLYGQLLKQGIEAKWTYIKATAQEEASDVQAMDIFDQFLYQAELGIRFAHQNPQYHQLANRFAKEKGASIYKTMMGLLGGDSTAMLKQMIDQAYGKGSLDPTFDKEFLYGLIERLLANYDDLIEPTGDLDLDLNNLKAFIGFMKSGFGVNK